MPSWTVLWVAFMEVNKPWKFDENSTKIDENSMNIDERFCGLAHKSELKSHLTTFFTTVYDFGNLLVFERLESQMFGLTAVVWLLLDGQFLPSLQELKEPFPAPQFEEGAPRLR